MNKRYDQCGTDCTTDCGHCKGAGRPERHEGWANRETWAVALQINNDQGWQESVHEALREHLGEYIDTGDGNSRGAAIEAGEIIRENVEETLMGDMEGSVDPWTGERPVTFTEGQWMARDDIGSLWRVDWTELGAAFLADLADE